MFKNLFRTPEVVNPQENMENLKKKMENLTKEVILSVGTENLTTESVDQETV